MSRPRRITATLLLTAALALTGGVRPAAAVGSGFNLFLLETDIAVGRTPVEPRLLLTRPSSVPATGVVLTVDLAAIAGTVELADTGPGCEHSDTTVRCAIDDMAPGEQREIHPVRLVAAAGAPVGPAGSITVRVSDVEGDEWRSDFSVRVLKPGPDIKLTASPPSEFNGVLVLPMEVTNDGDVPVRMKRLILRGPAGIRLGDYEHGRDCVLGDGTPAQREQAGPVTLDCRYEWDIPPGRTFPILEGGSSPPRFYVRIGPNTPGPADYRVTAEMILAIDEPDKTDNAVSWTITAPENTIDVAVTTKTARDGDTATVTWTVKNHGPSDATGHTVDVVAPSGTTLLPSPGCVARDGGLRCTSGTWLPANGAVTGTVRLRITGTPGTNGTVTVGGTGPSVESRPSNNTAAIVIGTAGGSPGGGGGGTLPITGPGSGLAGLGAGAVLLGALLLIGARRRPTPTSLS